MRKFWRKTEGFTLVELIVVIAILGILAGVGIVGYSGYIKKANMAADQQLVGQVKNALTLAAYSDPEFEGGLVVLSRNEAPEADDLEDAMEKTFGAGWETSDALKLKYDGWSATFQGSNFYGDENGLIKLLSTVDTLTGALADFLANNGDMLEGDGNFANYVNAMAADGDNSAKADAAVFYIADKIGGIDSTKMQDVIGVFGVQENLGNATKLQNALQPKLDGSILTTTAALYALAEGYASYCENNSDYTFAVGTSPRDYLTEFNNTIGTKSSTENLDAVGVYTSLFNTFQNMGRAGGSNGALTAYLNGPLEQDLNAFGEAMKTVSAAKENIVSAHPIDGSDAYFSSGGFPELLSSYAEGSVFVFALKSNGQIKITSTIDTETE